MKSVFRPFSAAGDGAFAPADDGFVHVMPYGEYEFNVPSGQGKTRKLVLVVDEPAVDKMIARFRQEAAAAGAAFAGMLVDFDHFSEDAGHHSEAAGWAVDMAKRADGLWAKVRWSDVGTAAIKGGRYRFTSGSHNVNDCEQVSPGRIRPTRLDRFALTNDPRMLQGAVRMQPISSRAVPAGEQPGQAGQKGTMDYRTILLKILGLPDTATDEEMQKAADAFAAEEAQEAEHKARIEEQGKENAALKSRAEKAEGELAALKADATLATLEGEGYKFTSRDSVRADLLKDHDGTVRVIRFTAPGAAGAGEQLRSRKDAKPPADDLTPEQKVAARQTFVDEMQAKFKLKSRASAVAKAQALKPELWK